MCSGVRSNSVAFGQKSQSAAPYKLKKRVLFAHGNGFPARTYATFLRALSPVSLRYVPLFGHDSLGRAFSSKWPQLLAQLLSCLDRSSRPVVGVGHSLGAVLCLQAYYLRPTSFTHLVLMDPPLFRPLKQIGIWLAQSIGQADLVISPARKARRRRTWWPSRAEAETCLRRRSLFKNFHPEAMQDYLRYGLKPASEKGLTLAFSQQIEYHIFRSTPARIRFSAIHVPCYLLYSATYEVCSYADIRYLAHLLPSVRFIPISGGHMFPFEQPEEIAHLIHLLLT